MRDPDDDQGVDRAYRAAVELLDGGVDAAAVQRRRHKVLEAIHAAHAPAVRAPRPDAAVAATASRSSLPGAANEPHWRRPAAWWGAASAACVMAGSALLVVHLLEQPRAVGSGKVADAGGTAALPPSVAVAPGGATPAAAPNLDQDAGPARRAWPGNEVRGAGDAAAKAAKPREEPPEAPRRVAPEADAVPERNTPSERMASAEEPQLEAAGAAAALPVAPARSEVASARADSTRIAEASASVMATESAAAQARSRAGSEAKLASAATGAVAVAQPSELLAAVAAGSLEAARALLARTGPDVDRDADGRTALALAVLRSDAPMVALLLGHGANRLAVDRHGQTPLGYALMRADPAVMQAFGLKSPGRD